MLLFVVPPWLHRRQRPPRPDDDVPFKPFSDFVSFWILLGIGAFSATLDVFAFIALIVFRIDATAAVLAVMIFLAATAVIGLRLSFVFWWRMRSAHG